MPIPATEITDASYDVNNRLVTWSGKAHTYDANGNMVAPAPATAWR